VKTRLDNHWEAIRTSFWFIPGLMILCVIGLSSISIRLDRLIDTQHFRTPGLIYAGGTEGAHSILSLIAGSMITVAGTAFSITIVALTLASSQFGPRLLRNFMLDTGNQVVLGVFISTFVYCLLVLHSVNSIAEHFFVPRISVTVAITLALVSVGILIYFIHHISTSIHADRVVAEVYRDLSDNIQRLFPDELDHRIETGVDDQDISKLTEKRDHEVLSVTASKSGYLQSVDHESLLRIAGENNFLIHIQNRPGEYIVEGSTLADVNNVKLIDEEHAERISKAFTLGPQRTPVHDVEFAIRQLVEIALRALSPGINDPFTAITCIDHLGSVLCSLTDRAFPRSNFYDDEDKLRIITKPLTFEGVTNAAFDQIRQYGHANVAVSTRLLETLKTVALHTSTSEQRKAVLRQADMIIHESQESIGEKNDRDDVQERYQELLSVLGRQA
jgi:uncharacterized membrane protein